MINKINAYNIRRFWVMFFGIILIGISIGFIKVASLGMDPCSACMMGIEKVININFAIILLFFNTLFFLVEVKWGRHLIGIGTFFNWLCVGTLINISTYLIKKIAYILNIQLNTSFVSSFIMFLFGLILLSLAVALYQVADMGVAPYDSLSLIIHEKFGVKYFWARMITDSTSVAVPIILGKISGIVGIGSILLAFCMGPFVQIFTDYVAIKLCYKNGIKL